MLHQFPKPLPSLRRLPFHHGVQCWHLSVLRRLPLGPFSGAHRGRGPSHRRKSFSVGGRHGAKVAERVKEVSIVPRNRGGAVARHRGVWSLGTGGVARGTGGVVTRHRGCSRGEQGGAVPNSRTRRFFYRARTYEREGAVEMSPVEFHDRGGTAPCRPVFPASWTGGRAKHMIDGYRVLAQNPQ